jgi:TolA-binding protein
LAEAETQIKRKNYRQGRNLLRIYLTRYADDPAIPDVRFKIGHTLYQDRDYRSALGEFYWVVQNAHASPVIHDALYYSGVAFAKLGQCVKANAYFTALIKKDSKAPDRYKEQAKKQIETMSKDEGKICTDRDPAPSSVLDSGPKPAGA